MPVGNEFPEALENIFTKIFHMYCDFVGVELLEDEMRAILETIAPELEEMDEADPR